MTALFNTRNQITKRYAYDSFGVEKNISSADKNPFRYCGEYYDTETGEIYLRNRYYSPVTGRFGSEDTHWNVRNMIYGDEMLQMSKDVCVPNYTAIMQSGSLYVYAINNPMNYVDPHGEAVRTVGIQAEAGVGVYVDGQLVYVDDDHGNEAVAVMIDGGGGLGLGAGVTAMEFPTMDNIYELKEDSVSVGMGIGILGANYTITNGHEGVGISGALQGKVDLGYSGTMSLATFFLWENPADEIRTDSTEGREEKTLKSSSEIRKPK